MQLEPWPHRTPSATVWICLPGDGTKCVDQTKEIANVDVPVILIFISAQCFPKVQDVKLPTFRCRGGQFGNMSKFAKMFATFLVMVLVFMALASKTFGSQADVFISHEIQGSDTIQVNCTKGSGYWAKHMAPQTLQFGGLYGWGFKPSVWGTTKYYCIFGWEGRTQKVRVWTESEWLPHWKTIPRPCSHCLWRVERDGFYRQPNDVGKAPLSVFVVGWP